METKWKTNTLIALLLVSVGALLSMMLTKSCSTPKEIVTDVTIQDSTVVRVDTNRYEKPKPISSIITGEYFVPFIERRFIKEEVILKDTIYIGGQTFYHTVKEYRDSTYYARISGINAFLEHIEVYPKIITQYVTKTEKVAVEPKKLSLWAGAEIRKYGSKFSAPISLEARYNENRYEIFASCGYDLINNSEMIEVGAKRRF